MDLYLTVLHFQNVFIFNEASKFYHHVLKVRLYKFDNFLFNFLKIDNLLDGFRHHLKFSFRTKRAVWTSVDRVATKNKKCYRLHNYKNAKKGFTKKVLTGWALKSVWSGASKEILILAML